MKEALKRLFHSLGVDVRPYASRHFPARRRAEFFQDRRIDLVIDVGANRGQWSAEVRREGYRGRIICFEPLIAPFQALREPEKTCAALGDREGTVALNVAGNSQSSSVKTMSERHVTAEPTSVYVGVENVPLHRLDKYGFNEPCFLKIDAQGSELDILRGAEETLAYCVGLEMELSLVELYEGQALAQELIPYAYELGFRMMAIWPDFTDPKNGEVLQINAMFARL